MLRRIIALVLTFTAIVVLFTGCKKDDSGETSTNPLSTSDTTTTEAESTTTTAPSTTGATYILTTNQDKQAPWYSTTRFVPSTENAVATTSPYAESSVSNMYDNITYPTSGAETPSVSAVTSAVNTTVWSTLATTTDSDDENDENEGDNGQAEEQDTTEAGTTSAKAKGAQVVINDVYIDSDGRVCASIDSEGWGKIKSNSLRVPVYIDGLESDSPGTLQISSSTNADGFQFVYIDVSAYDVVETGAMVSFTIPEGFLKNASGSKYNFACEVTM